MIEHPEFYTQIWFWAKNECKINYFDVNIISIIVHYYYFAGEMTLYAGGQQPNQTVNVGSNVLVSSFTIIESNTEVSSAHSLSKCLHITLVYFGAIASYMTFFLSS